MRPTIEKFPRELELVPNHAALQLCVATAFAEAADIRSTRPAPPVRILSQWCRELVERSECLAGRAVPLAPPTPQLTRLWTETLSADTGELMPAERVALARTAMGAERLLQQWLEPANRARDEALAAVRFRRWRSLVHAQLQARGWCAPGWHLERLVELLDERQVPAACLPASLSLHGFGEITRQETRLLAALEGSGVNLAQARGNPPATPEPRCFTDLGAELGAAADWAAELTRTGERRVAVVVNGLPGLRERVVRIFEDRLAPGAILGFAKPSGGAVHIAGGLPLSAHPLVRSALLLLRLSLGGPRQAHDFPLISQWLLSPGWASAQSERFQRALLEHELRRQGDYRWTLARVTDLASRSGATELRRLLSRMPRNADLFAWLQYWGWPGEAPQDALSAPAVQALVSLLEQVTALAPEGGHGALALLQEWCAEQTVEGGGGALSPVQVLGPEGALCGRFDAIWLANFTDRNWPGPAHHNGLLSGAALDAIPRARPEGQLAWARGLGERLSGAAAVVIVSWSEAEQGVPQALSPLFDSAPRAPEPVAHLTSLARIARPQAVALAGYRDHPWLQACAPAERVPWVDPPTQLKGAVGLLELQSACPFAAFLVHRLAAGFEPPPPLFATPAFTGGLVHRALERLYQPAVDAGHLPLAEEVAAAVDAALAEKHADLHLLPAVLAAERARIVSLLQEWLAFEATRPPARVLDLEQKLQGALNGFEITLRLDRADRQGDGGLLIIDYKTGIVNKPRWGEARLGDLQLPLYAVLLARAGQDTGGVALAQLRRGDCHLRGMSRDAGLCAGKLTTVDKAEKAFAGWDVALATWSQWLEALAQEYRDGHCAHQVHFQAPLQYAGLEPLLREAELSAWEQAHDRH